VICLEKKEPRRRLAAGKKSSQKKNERTNEKRPVAGKKTLIRLGNPGKWGVAWEMPKQILNIKKKNII